MAESCCCVGLLVALLAAATCSMAGSPCTAQLGAGELGSANNASPTVICPLFILANIERTAATTSSTEASTFSVADREDGGSAHQELGWLAAVLDSLQFQSCLCGGTHGAHLIRAVIVVCVVSLG